MKKFFTYELAVGFYQEAKQIKMPYHLKEQFERASSSIVLNLAEGSAKPTAKDRRKFYHIALGSLRECQAIFALIQNHGASKKADFLGACLYKLCKGTA